LKRGSVQGTTVQSRSTVKDFKILEKADLCRNAFVIDHVGPVESKIRKERQATENRVEVVTLRKKEVETHIKNNK
jgi:nucleoside-triphosphatase THEP1